MNARMILPYELAYTILVSERTLRRWRKDRRENTPGREHGPVYIQDAPGRPVRYHIDDVHNWLVVTGRGGIIGRTYYPNMTFDQRCAEIEQDRKIVEETMLPNKEDSSVLKTLGVIAGAIVMTALVLALIASNIVTAHERDVAQRDAEKYAQMYEHETSTRVRLLRYVQTKYALNDRMAERLTDAYVLAGKQYDVDPRLLVSVSRAESYFQPEAVSFAGARGVMQVMPEWSDSIEYVQSPDDLFDPRVNIMAGAHILRHYLDQCGGGVDIRMALACYHGGPDRRRWGPRTRQYPDTVLAEYRRL